MQVPKESIPLYHGVLATIEADRQTHLNINPIARPHMHSRIEVLYCTTGGYQAILNGKEYILAPGDLLLINSWEVHETATLCQGENSYWVLKVPTEVLYNTSCSVHEAQYALPFSMVDYRHPRLLKAVELEHSPVPKILQNIMEEWENAAYGYELELRAALCHMFAWILRYWNQNEMINRQRNKSALETRQWLQQVLDYIDKNFNQPLEASKMAERCNFSYSYFSHLFRQTTGCTFNEYVNARRMAEAERLLYTTDATVTDIALQVGYGDPAYFIQKFRKKKGVSPGKFRTICREKAKS